MSSKHSNLSIHIKPQLVSIVLIEYSKLQNDHLDRFKNYVSHQYLIMKYNENELLCVMSISDHEI